MSVEFSDWLAVVPKAELHLHIDGSLQAARMLSLAEKNRIALPYRTIEQVEAAYEFDNLQSFLELYYLGASVLVDEEDFYHLMMDYLLKCRQQNIVHTEIMVEPQTYAPNGVRFATMMTGFTKAIEEAKAQWGQSVILILSVLRHLSEEAALATLAEASEFRDHFTAVGLASSELGNPPEKFKNFYSAARTQGYRTTIHAGEEGPSQFIWDAIQKLCVERIDHGVRCSQDTNLLDYLVESQIALTVCPLSNVRLCVFDTVHQHNILELLNRGVNVTVNSDDPAYFGGYLNENFLALHNALGLTKSQAEKLISNAFNASFLSESEQQKLRSSLSE